MLTDKKILQKLERIEERYVHLRFEKVGEISMEICETKEHFRKPPTSRDGVKWQPAKPGMKWGGNWMTAWFRGDYKAPQSLGGKKVLLRAKTNAESMLFIDFEPSGLFTGNHPVVMMAKKAEAGKKYDVAVEAYAGHDFPGCSPNETLHRVTRGCRTFDGCDVVLERQDVTAFVADLRTLRQLAKCLSEDSLRRGKVIAGLAEVFAVVDAMPEEMPEESWRSKLADARKIMKPLLESKNGPTMPWAGVIGHSHMDTAWLWPLAETWRKCARTYSSILNLMEQYPDFMFLQAAPCHTDVIRREYPGLFKRIKRAVAKGKWEPNGGMWVEPDCNVPSGEALVRQLLVGQTATREMFGYTSNTLWLPDVFGYSAALPQILQGCRVEYFCTTKIGWNDTTRFPYDTFVWKGIDGTSVIAHYNAIHCWPEPEALIGQWNWVQHKDNQDRRLCAFGYGDGGGGPMAEQLEMAKRIGDLEGCPRSKWISVGDFMDGIRDEVPNLPEFAGELYLEYHRGTLTSISQVKKGNRKTELALRDAELLATMAMLRGKKYPSDRFLEMWKKLLTNQFHDILPGSSIAEVNDEAILDFADCITKAKVIGEESLKTLGAEAGKSPSQLLIVNSLSWDRSGEVVLSGVPEGMVIADADATCQWIEDPEGCAKLAVAGLKVPALGAKAVALAKGKGGGQSPFKVSERGVETPKSVVKFDKAGRIASLLDKASGREVVKAGGALNTLLVGEDIPESWDNWDIDRDQRLKMKADGRLISRKVVSDGPLQLRIRSVYEIGAASRLTQDIVFHADSARIDFETMVDWKEKHKLLKAGFELDVLADFARHEIQYGHAERPTHENQMADRARFEVCAHKWTDLSENGFGVALLNDCKYGVGVKGSELRLSLLKSGTHPDPRGDNGRRSFTYSLLPHACGFSAESVVRPAYELNVPAIAAPAGGKAQCLSSLIEVDAPNVIIESVKKAEKGKGIVVRLYEAEKTGVNANLKFNVPVKSVSETNMLEEEPKSLKVRGGKVSLFVRAFEIKTLLLDV
ncbi:MAG TPA: glycoside hydrolase family 38 C-terminal domain-containing protein [Candidatus Brocadiia bacterium]|nr:glycoside hydrolase family 38 C-terminal domain-containing protein [Candidatus Brocadiia bacterium]